MTELICNLDEIVNPWLHDMPKSIAVSYTHLDVYKRQLSREIDAKLNSIELKLKKS